MGPNLKLRLLFLPWLIVGLIASQSALLSFHDAKHVAEAAQRHAVSVEQPGCSICTALHAPASHGAFVPPLATDRAPELLGAELARIAESVLVARLPGARAPPSIS